MTAGHSIPWSTAAEEASREGKHPGQGAVGWVCRGRERDGGRRRARTGMHREWGEGETRLTSSGAASAWKEKQNRAAFTFGASPAAGFLLVASRLSRPDRPDQCLEFLSFFFFFPLSVLIVYLFLLPVQPLPSAGAPAAPIPGARPMGRAGCPSLPLLHLHLNLRERIQQLRLQGRGEEKRGGGQQHTQQVSQGLGAKEEPPVFQAGRAHRGVRARSNLP